MTDQALHFPSIIWIVEVIIISLQRCKTEEGDRDIGANEQSTDGSVDVDSGLFSGSRHGGQRQAYAFAPERQHFALYKESNHNNLMEADGVLEIYEPICR